VYPETHSQYDEDQAIAAHFARWHMEHEITKRFLDIGAWDPICFSNTRALFERGWSGVMIEPSPTAMLSLLKEYGNEPRITIVQAAASVENVPQRMWMTADAVSTSDPASYEKNKRDGGFFGQATVMPITWEMINNLYGGFDFVNIDTEGVSVDLFHSMLISGAKPSCTCVEHDGRLTELAAAATKVGYKMTYANGTNAVLCL
jgi:hypothetical protein